MHSNAITIPTTSSTPKPRTIGTGESVSTSIAAALAAAAVAIVGAPTRAAARTAARRRSEIDPAVADAWPPPTRDWNWIA